MSASEFGEWQVFIQKEGLHPAADRLRHAQLLAGIHNGALSRHDKQPWTAATFMGADPWAPEVELVQPTAQTLQAQIDGMNARMD